MGKEVAAAARSVAAVLVLLKTATRANVVAMLNEMVSAGSSAFANKCTRETCRTPAKTPTAILTSVKWPTSSKVSKWVNTAFPTRHPS